MRYKSSYKQAQKKKSKFKPALLLLTGVILANLFIGKTEIQKVEIQIPKGASLNMISDILKEKGLIESKILFKAYLKTQGEENKLMAGNFEIPSSASYQEISEILQKYQSQTKIVLIAEGLKTTEIQAITPAQCLKQCVVEHKVLEIPSLTNLKNLEGLLFPDTYYLDLNNHDPNQLLIKMLDNFYSKLPLDYQDKLKSLPRKDLYSTIIVASLIEKEVKTTQDKALVSGIIWKRLENNWQLGIDAALLYLKDDNKITFNDLQADNPYNLRKKTGLPPTPITNPGYESIYAALNPQASSYWFYLSKASNGKTVFSKTNTEHNINKQKYL